jgi:VWFA-related protein
MFLRPLKRVIAALFLLSGLSLICPAQTTSENYPGLTMEFPAGGQLRIENQLGGVAAESWSQKYVYVTASGEAGSPKLSAVVIENGSQGFAIRVVRKPGAPLTPIDLTIKFPESARVEIETGSGQVSLRGLPAAVTVKSINGDIKADLAASAGVDIVARAAQGAVRSELPQPLSENGHVLQAQLGNGAKTLRLNSETGDITLSLMSDARDRAATAPLIRNSVDDPAEAAAKGAGVPAPALDPQDVDDGDVVRVDSQMAALNLSVVDRNTKHGLIGLTQSDFRLFENGAPQQILQFDSSSAPFDLFLLIDLSGSTREVLKLIRAAAVRFVDAARPSDRIGVITFAGQATVVSPPTLDRQALRARIAAMDTAPGDTKLYDALDFAEQQAEKDAKSRRRTAIILMSDGLDGSIPGVKGDGSKLPYKDLLSHIAEFDGVVYTLWLNTEYEALHPDDTQPEAFEAGYDRMKETADIGGGVFYEVDRLEDLAGAYERVVADLGTVYSLAYRPSDKTRDGKWRAIRVDVVSRPSAIARGKRGYYAN